MPFDFQQFMTRVKTKNRLFTLQKSALQPLIALIQNKTMFSPTEKANIERVAAFMPFDKRQKYSNALQYLSQSANVSTSAIPHNPKMEFVKFCFHTGFYAGTNGTGQKSLVWLDPRGNTPQNAINLGARGYVHRHKLSWSSSDGNAMSLANVLTREHVKFLADTQAPPFNRFADPDREFYMPQAGAAGATSNEDDHFTKFPALICCNPRVAGEIVAEQRYQYSVDQGATWRPIEGAAYLIKKSVYPSGNDWVFVFKKTNWSQHNNKAFHFEVEYTVGPFPAYLPATEKDVQRSDTVEANITTYARRVIADGK